MLAGEIGSEIRRMECTNLRRHLAQKTRHPADKSTDNGVQKYELHTFLKIQFLSHAGTRFIKKVRVVEMTQFHAISLPPLPPLPPPPRA